MAERLAALVVAPGETSGPLTPQDFDIATSYELDGIVLPEPEQIAVEHPVVAMANFRPAGAAAATQPMAARSAAGGNTGKILLYGLKRVGKIDVAVGTSKSPAVSLSDSPTVEFDHDTDGDINSFLRRQAAERAADRKAAARASKTARHVLQDLGGKHRLENVQPSEAGSLKLDVITARSRVGEALRQRFTPEKLKQLGRKALLATVTTSLLLTHASAVSKRGDDVHGGLSHSVAPTNTSELVGFKAKEAAGVVTADKKPQVAEQAPEPKKDTVFPLVISKEELRKGSSNGAGTLAWNHDCLGKGCHHHYYAADIFAKPGTQVVAAKGGVVKRVRNVSKCGAGGKYKVPRVTIEAEDGLIDYYTHMAVGSLEVEEGQRLEAGDPIGKVGPTECAQGTAPHLHYQRSEGEVGSTEKQADRAKTRDPQPLLQQAYADLEENDQPVAPTAPPVIEASVETPPAPVVAVDAERPFIGPKLDEILSPAVPTETSSPTPSPRDTLPQQTLALIERSEPRIQELTPIYDKVAAELGIPSEILTAIHYRETGSKLPTNVSTMAGEKLGTPNPDHPELVINTFEDGLRASGQHFKDLARMVYGIQIDDLNTAAELQQAALAYNRGFIGKREGYGPGDTPYVSNGLPGKENMSWPAGDPLAGRIDGNKVGFWAVYQALNGPRE